MDALDPADFVGPVVVLDCVAEAARNEDYELSIADVENWEARHGRIPEHAWVLMRNPYHRGNRAPM